MLRRLSRIAVLLLVVGGAAFSQVERVRWGITYAERGRKKLRLDLHLPSGEGPHPTMLVIHGGGWKFGLRSVGDPLILALGLNREGIAAASVSFRQAPGHPHPAQIKDIRRAIQFLRYRAPEFGIDPLRLGVIGASSGGHLAALLAAQDDGARPLSRDPVERQSTRPICAVSICAPLVLEPTLEEEISPQALRILLDFLGVKSLDSDRARLRALRLARDASPATYVTKDDPAMLLIHGALDPLVPVSQTSRMAEALAKARVPHQVQILPKEGHCAFVFRFGRDGTIRKYPWWEKTRVFLRERLVEVGPADEKQRAREKQRAH